MLKALFPIHHHFADFTGLFLRHFVRYSETCNLRENNSTKINRSVTYALDSSCCRSHFCA